MFKLAQKKKEEQDKREREAKHGYSKQMSIRSKLLTQGTLVTSLSFRFISVIFCILSGIRGCRTSTGAAK